MPEICEALSYKSAVTLPFPWKSWEIAEVFDGFNSGGAVLAVNKP